MARYEIHGGKQLNGTVTISGAKNAAVAILPATLLVSGRCRIENVPDISDVRILLDILEGMGAKIEIPETNVVEIDCSGVTCSEPDSELVIVVMTNGCKTTREDGIMRITRRLAAIAEDVYIKGNVE